MKTTKTDTTAKCNIFFGVKPMVNRFSWMRALLLLTCISFLSTLQTVWAVENKVSRVRIAGTSTTYKIGDTIQIYAECQRGVEVTGSPRIKFTIGTATEKYAGYQRNDPKSEILFQYTVVKGDEDTDGIAIPANAIDLNGGTIKDSPSGKAFILNHKQLLANPSHKVDGVAPKIKDGSPSITSSAGDDNTYVAGDVIQVSVTFKETAKVTGTPQIGVTIGSNTRQATYHSGTDTATLVFQYTVVTGDADTDGISIAANALALNGGTIKDLLGNAANAADLAHSALATQAAHIVDGVPPTINSLSITSNAGSHNTYITNDTIQVAVAFSEAVAVTGTPQIGLTIGSNTRQASYSSGTNTATLVFTYTVVTGDEDTDGIATAANALGLNSGTIKDLSGTAATLTHSALTAQAAHKVDTTASTINSVSITSTPTSGNTYTPGDAIQVQVIFSEAVNVSGIPQLPLTIGTNTRQALYQSGTNTATLVFKYTVVEGDEDTDGISIAANVLNGGTITDVVGHPATLTHLAVAAQAAHKVDGIKPTVQMVSITSNAGTDNTYTPGDVIQVQVTFSENVVVTGKPQIGLTIGNNTRAVPYGNLVGANSLAFAYTVAVGDEDTDGISIDANALALNGGTITDVIDNAATVTHLALPTDASHKVDGVAPTVNGSPSITSNAGTDNTYVAGDVIQVSVTFSETVVVTGKPQIALTLDAAATRQAIYQSGDSTPTLLFQYTIVAGDTDTDGIATTMNALALNNGTITDTAGNVATLTHPAVTTQASHKVDTTAPTINSGSPSITSSAGADDTYISGDVIDVSVTFSETVKVTGTPQIGLTIGNNTRQATYQSGDSTPTLVFKYTVATGDVDADGISIAANVLNGGTIADSAGNAATLTYTTVAAAATHKVDAVAPTINGSPSITSTPTSGNTYTPDEVIEVSVTFSETVLVTGTPQIALTIGSDTRQATYQSGNSTTTLVFAYTLATGDEDSDGISIAADALALNGGTIKDAIGNAATVTHSALATQAAHKVDTAEPTVRSISISSDAGTDQTYKTDDKIEVKVTFNETVEVTGTPQIALTIGSDTRQATYQSGNSTTTLVFAYTLATGDEDSDGISIAADALALNGGAIKNGSDINAILEHSAVTNQAAHKVDTTAPTVNSSPSITSTANSNNTYTDGEVIQVEATFSETVAVTGTPQIGLTIGENTRQATYDSGTDTATLVFQYTVAIGDVDSDGIAIAADALTGTITDLPGNPATLTHAGATDAASHQVDAVAPTINSVRISSSAGDDNTYVADDPIQVEVEFSEPVHVTGEPQIALTIGSNTRQATYQSGTNTTTLLFQYTIVAGDTDTDGIATTMNALALNNGTITDTAGNVATLTHPAVTTQASHKVDTTAPTINSDSPSITSGAGDDNTYIAGDVIDVSVTFSEPVVVTGSPQLPLVIGNTTRQADYQSGDSTSTTLVFKYTVVAGDNDTDGISIIANTLTLNGGTIVDNVSNAADLAHSVVSPDTSHQVDTIQPIISGITIANTPLTVGSEIRVTVVFSEAVNVDTTAGTPFVTLTMDTAVTRPAEYKSGAGTPADPLLFTYTLDTGDSAPNGISIDANALASNDRTITDTAGNSAIITHQSVSADPSRKVDTVAPTITSLWLVNPAGDDGIYIPGEILRVKTVFSEQVIVTGTPSVTLRIGTADRQATYESGNGDTTLVFAYRVTPNDTDTDGISIDATKLALNGGGIVDSAGNAADVTHPTVPTSEAHKVDGVQPAIDNVSITSTGPYSPWSNIELTVTTTKPVYVTGSPVLTVTIGNTGKKANYHQGSGTNALVFEYTIAATDGSDTNGVSVRTNSLSLNGGSIVDASGNALSLNHDALRDAGDSHRVDTTAPGVTSVAFSSTGPYGTGSLIAVTATLSESVTVTGAPTLTIVIGTTERTASYVSGTGTSQLVFRYAVSSGDSDDSDGVSVKANSLNLNGGTITDLTGNAVDLKHSGVPNAGDTQRVGTTVSGIRSLTFTSTGPYTAGDIIKVTVATTEQVTVTGVPRLALVIGIATKYANYASGSGSTSLVFEYTVVDGDDDLDGVEITQNALANHNGSSIQNSYGTALSLSHAGVAADETHIVDAMPPDITAVAFATDPATANLEVVLTFEETGVQVTPAANGAVPTVTLLFGSNSMPDSEKTEVEVPYTESRPGSTKLVFAYAVTADTPVDADGVQLKPSSLKIPAGGTIRDANGNAVEASPLADGSSIVAVSPSKPVSSPPIFPLAASTGVIFNEFRNASQDKNDWVELRNTTSGDISLGGWKLDLSADGSPTYNNVFKFPEMALPAGAVLLLINAPHKQTELELSNAYSYRYFIAPQLRLPKTDFVLLLRNGSGAVADVVGDYFGTAASSDLPIAFENNLAYFREAPDKPGHEAAAWREVGYQAGLGYDRNASKNTSQGTPGYANSASTPEGASGTSVSISEIMFTTGKTGRLPQWIELYNSSKTDIISLRGWRLQVEGYDPDSAPARSFITVAIQEMQILPNQTVLIVTKTGRNSKHFPDPRVYNLAKQAPQKLEQTGGEAKLMKENGGFAITLRDEQGDVVDVAGNLDGDNSTREEPKWKLFDCVTRNGNRLSIIRQFEEGKPLTGTQRSSWFRATDIGQKSPTYYGHSGDIGNPGYKKGGPLPVQLSSFKAERTDEGCVITWDTESSLENAGFNVLRSETKNGPFTKVNPRLIPGAGTTSERSTYTFIDKGTKPRNHYYYQLEEVSFAGVQQPLTTQRLKRNISPIGQQLTMLGALKQQSSYE